MDPSFFFQISESGSFTHMQSLILIGVLHLTGGKGYCSRVILICTVFEPFFSRRSFIVKRNEKPFFPGNAQGSVNPVVDSLLNFIYEKQSFFPPATH